MTFSPPEFKVVIPADRIAQYPPEARGDSRLLVVDRSRDAVVHIGEFCDILRFIAGDLIVLNDTKVSPARVSGHKPGGGRVEALFMIGDPLATHPGGTVVHALINPARRLKSGLILLFPESATLTLTQRRESGGWEGIWNGGEGVEFLDWLHRVGEPPLPPYIKRRAEEADRQRYQTIYAQNAGSIAAPTAGLHFTVSLLDRLASGGSELVRLTLDVGWGTFEPLKNNDLNHHRMHRESYTVAEEASEAINRAKAAGRKVVAVGTTSVRALEDSALQGLPITAGRREAGIFIRPPYEFKVVDRLITNFHRPDSTLLQLAAAMTGWDLLNDAYQQALDEGFRFYSYGDAMLIL